MRIPRIGVSLAVLALAAPVAAQPDPFVRPLPPAAAGTDTLGHLLRELAYEPKALSPDVFQITIERDRWPVHVMLSLSTDGRRVWLESKFAPIEDPDRVPSEAWKRLLEANEKIGPAHFAFDKADRRVHLYKSFDNQGLNAERLKREVEHFDATVRKTQEYWRGDNFKTVIASSDAAPIPPAAPLPPPPPEAKAPPVVPESKVLLPDPEPRDEDLLIADWRIVEIHVKGRKTPDEVLGDRKPSLVFERFKSKLMAELRTGPDRTRRVSVVLHADRPTKQIDFNEEERTEEGIYKIEGDTLTVCFAAPGEPRPTTFTTTQESRNWVIVLKKR